MALLFNFRHAIFVRSSPPTQSSFFLSRTHATKPTKPPLHGDALLRHVAQTNGQSPVLPVYYVDEQGQFQGKHDLRLLMRTIDSSKQFLVQVGSQPAPANDPARGPTWPVVKLVSLLNLRPSSPSPSSSITNGTNVETEKEIRVGCSVAPQDLAIKSHRIRSFLSKGYRVKLTVLHRRGEPVEKVAETMNSLFNLIEKDIGQVAVRPRLMGKNSYAVVVGKKLPPPST